MAGVKKVNEEEFKEAIKTDKLVVCDFFATWCGPCKAIAPSLDTMANENQNVVFIKVDVDECQDLMESYKVTAMPTLVMLKNGREVGRVVGADLNKFKQMLSANI